MKLNKAKAQASPSSTVDWAEVNRALDFMNQHGLEEFEFAHGETRIRLKKPGVAHVIQGSAHPIVGPSASSPQAASMPAPSAGGAVAVPESAVAENLHIVKSPIVGTFYASPNPDAPAYVKVGDRVTAGQVLCIIEAMKLMNEIEADIAGEIVKVLATNAQPVEYGEGLFAIRPDKK